MFIRVFEAFAGYGSQAMALRRLKDNYPQFDYNVVGISEIDKYALQAYQAVHGHCPNYGDISKIDWNNVPDFDLFTYSFPCTDISCAGLQKGLSKDSGTRSSLLWECQRAIEIKRPKYLLMENVPNLLAKKHIHHFREWRDMLRDYGFSSFTKILHAPDFGEHQNRERVFMVSILGDCQYYFPEPFNLERTLADVLEDKVDDKYFLSDKMLEYFQRVNSDKSHNHKFAPKCKNEIACTISSQSGSRVDDNYIIDIKKKVIQIGNIVDDTEIGFKNPQRGRIYSTDGIAPTLNCCGGGGLEPKILQLPRGFNRGGVHNISPTIVGSSYYLNNFLRFKRCIRILTPRECLRLMDVTEEDIDKLLNSGISNSQLYKLAGNSIVVSCLYHIFRKMFVEKENESKQLTLF